METSRADTGLSDALQRLLLGANPYPSTLLTHQARVRFEPIKYSDLRHCCTVLLSHHTHTRYDFWYGAHEDYDGDYFAFCTRPAHQREEWSCYGEGSAGCAVIDAGACTP